MQHVVSVARDLTHMTTSCRSCQFLESAIRMCSTPRVESEAEQFSTQKRVWKKGHPQKWLDEFMRSFLVTHKFACKQVWK